MTESWNTIIWYDKGATCSADKSVLVYGRRLLSWCEELTIYMQLDQVFNVVVNTLIGGCRVACMQSQYVGHKEATTAIHSNYKLNHKVT